MTNKQKQTTGPLIFSAENRASLVNCIVHCFPELAPKEELILQVYRSNEVSMTFILYDEQPNVLLAIAECIAFRSINGTDNDTVMRIAKSFRNCDVQNLLNMADGLIPETKEIVNGVANVAETWSATTELVLRSRTKQWLRMLKDSPDNSNGKESSD